MDSCSATDLTVSRGWLLGLGAKSASVFYILLMGLTQYGVFVCLHYYQQMSRVNNITSACFVDCVCVCSFLCL